MPNLPTAAHAMNAIKAIDGKQTDYADNGKHGVRGLRLRVSPSGTKTWSIYTRRPGTKGASRIALGDYGDLTLSEARNAARSFKEKMRAGIDPVSERRRVMAESLLERDATFETFCEIFLIRHVASLRPTTAGNYTRVVKKLLIPAWGKLPVGEITGREIISLIDLEEARAPVSAKFSFSVIHKLFAFAVARQVIDRSPCEGLKSPATPKARDRILDDGEILAFWSGCEDLGGAYGPALKFLLVTGQRRSEVGGARWSEIDLKTAVWTIPSGRTKNGKAHVVDLSPLALEILADQPRFGPLVFETGRGEKGQPLNGWGRTKKRIDAIIGDVPSWRLHDLRRTAASGMAAAGAAPHVIEKVLNHTSGVTGGLVAVYQRYDHRAERAAALMTWGRTVERLIGRETGEVVPLKAG
jgi:integrase